MSVSFIYGRAGSGKSEYILNCIKKIVCETGEDIRKKFISLSPNSIPILRKERFWEKSIR